jgi:hypothetical protein
LLCSCGVTAELLCSCGVTAELLCSCGVTAELLCSCGVTAELLCSCGVTAELLCSCVTIKRVTLLDMSRTKNILTSTPKSNYMYIFMYFGKGHRKYYLDNARK